MTLREQIANYLSEFQSFRVLSLVDRDRLGNILLDRLWLLDEKISRSPFHAAQQDDALQKGFPAALDKWVRSFAPEAMAGALILGLTVDYFTEEELGHLLSNSSKMFTDHNKNTQGTRNEYDIYQLTRATDIHSRFRRSIGVADINRSGVQPAATIEEALFKAAMLLRSLAQGDETDSPYYSPSELVRTFAGRHIILIEDWSLSGTTMARSVERLYKVWSTAFSQVLITKLASVYGFLPPQLTVVVLLTTDIAVEKMSKTFEALPGMELLRRPVIIKGCTLKNGERLTEKTMPPWCSELDTLVPKANVRGLIDLTLNGFAEIARIDFRTLLRTLEFPENVVRNDDVLKFGFQKGGWTIIGHHNAPNNSLPMLWHSAANTQGKQYSALFARVESHHSSYAPEIDAALETAKSKTPLIQAHFESLALENVFRAK